MAAMAGRIDAIIDPMGRPTSCARHSAPSSAAEAAAEAGRAAWRRPSQCPELITFSARRSARRLLQHAVARMRRADRLQTGCRCSLQSSASLCGASSTRSSQQGSAPFWEGRGRATVRGPSASTLYHVGPVTEGAQIVGLVLICREIRRRRLPRNSSSPPSAWRLSVRWPRGSRTDQQSPQRRELKPRSAARPEELRASGRSLGRAERAARRCAGGDRPRAADRAICGCFHAAADKQQLVDVEAVLELSLPPCRTRDPPSRPPGAPIQRRAAGLQPTKVAAWTSVSVNLPYERRAGHFPRGADDNTIRVTTTLSADGRVLIRILDTGSGIAPGFATFVHAVLHHQAGRRGTGLGLSICQRIISSLGARSL